MSSTSSTASSPGNSAGAHQNATAALGQAGTTTRSQGQSSAGAAVAPTATSAPTAGIPAGARIERTANLSIEVRPDRFDSTLDRVFAVMRDLGGYVSGSNMSGDSGGLRNGTVSFKVPSTRFEDAIARVRQLGTVKALAVGGTDVSGQYVDLQARLRNQQAQEQAMLALYSQAKGVPDIVALQNQLSTIRDTIERIKGQLAFYDSQVDYSTVSVSVAQAGLATTAGNDEWGFQTALVQAAHYAVSSVNIAVVVAGASLPLLLLGLLVLLVGRRVLQRTRWGPRLA